MPAPIPQPPPPLGRGDLLQAVAAAAASFAEGGPYPEGAAKLAGRRFKLRLPFGCAGPGPSGAPLEYSYDPEKQTLKLIARPRDWSDTAWAETLADGKPVEAVEGFWISRPWMTSDGCPAAAAPPAAEPDAEPGAKTGAAPVVRPDAETVGVGQVFTAEGSRLPRRGGRPYEVTRKVVAGDAPKGEFHLVLEGRVADAQGRPIRCRSGHPDQRPTCLVVVEFERAAFEDAEGQTLATWGT